MIQGLFSPFFLFLYDIVLQFFVANLLPSTESFVANMIEGEIMAVQDGYCRLKAASVGYSQHKYYMSSNIRIKKICDHCKEEFEARTLHTRYCSHLCNRHHYKQLKREEKLRSFNDESEKLMRGDESGDILEADTLNITTLQSREYLSISETAIYLGVSKRTVERAVATGSLEVKRMGRRVIIPKEHISKLLGA